MHFSGADHGPRASEAIRLINFCRAASCGQAAAATCPPARRRGTRHRPVGTVLQWRRFTELVVSGTGPVIDFDWGAGSPYQGVDPDSFSVRWTGQIQAYTLTMPADDGVKLWVSGEFLIDRFAGIEGGSEPSTSINLTAGRKYDIRIDYFEGEGKTSIMGVAEHAPSAGADPVPDPRGGAGAAGRALVAGGRRGRAVRHRTLVDGPRGRRDRVQSLPRPTSPADSPSWAVPAPEARFRDQGSRRARRTGTRCAP